MEDKIVKFGEVLNLEKLDEYLNTLKAIQDRILQQLEEGIDYGKPFEKSTQKILYFAGARKLAKVMRVSVEIKVDETIEKGGDIWGRKVILRMSLPNGDFVESFGVCSYDEPASWNRDKENPSQRYKKPFYIISQLAYKRAYVNGIKMLLGLPDFLDVELEQSEKGEDVSYDVEPVVKSDEASDKQLTFMADLFLKRHLTMEVSYKFINRLKEHIANKGYLTKDVVSSAIEYLTKLQKTDPSVVRESWNETNDLMIFDKKLKLLQDIFDRIKKRSILVELGQIPPSKNENIEEDLF
jgi:hypothetical protein